MHPVIIQNVYPELNGGRYPVKREVGDALVVEADIIKEGHDVMAAVLKYREASEIAWREAPMRFLENDRWRSEFPLEKNGRYRYTIEAWPDAFESWRHDLEKRLDVEQAVTLELQEGRDLVAQAAERAPGADRKQLEQALTRFDQMSEDADRIDLLLTPTLRRLMARNPDRSLASVYEKELEVIVDRVAARYAAWYEMFPRSQGTVEGRGATFKDCERRLPEVRGMGFDVVYFVPIHPIGKINRKGPNNNPVAGPHDPGSPYAIGSDEGGHKAVNPELGTLDDFRQFVAKCHEMDMEVALDFAIQCAPDHPYVKAHPDWFKWRPDGTIKYAENPPKKYQDIVPVQFYGPHQDELWREWRDVVLFWVDQGVKIFRVDNPHTKPIPFWEWLIREVQDTHPDVIFLSEAFTRPKLLQTLAKAGFSQSYTYFTWRNFKQELTDYLAELTQSECKEFLRPNFFPNTPDILPQFLQTGGRPAFMIRFVLAATLSSVYGIYNGFELCEAAALPGKEEYLDSEKFQHKVWDWDRAGNIKDLITAINRIRQENPALQELENLRFHPADDDNVLFYGKSTFDGDNRVFVAVNLDPFEPHQAVLDFPLEEMGIRPNQTFQVEELLTGRKHLWRGRRHTVDLDPQTNPAEIYRISGWVHKDYVETCY